MSTNTSIIITTRIQLADSYGVSTKTLNRWLKEKNLNIPSGYLTPATLELIFAHLGIPKRFMSDFGAFVPKVPITSR